VSTPEIIHFEPNGPADQGMERIHELTPDVLEEGDPTELAYNYYTSACERLSAGVWDCTPCVGKLAAYECDEFMLVLDGSVTIVYEDGDEETFRAGDAFAIHKGLVCQWKQTESMRKYYVIFQDPDVGIPERPVSDRAIRLNPQGPAGVGLEPIALQDLSLFEGELPKQEDHTYFEDATGQLCAGVWTCSPMRRKADRFPRVELMCLLEGSTVLTDSSGQEHKFHAPDVLLVEKDTTMSWTSTESVRKFYCIFETANTNQ
jgi:uncharacterized cupin superfamily protein